MNSRVRGRVSLFLSGGSGWRPEILIVGGSFAGLTLALALARQGKQPLVVERLEEPPRLCKADVIHARTADILSELGAGEALQEGTLPLHVVRLGFEGRPSVPLDLRPVLGRPDPLRAVDHQRLLPVLRRLAAEAGAQFLAGTAVAVLREGGAVQGIRLSDGTTLLARLTVGADGANSLVRRSMGVPERRWSPLAAGTAFVVEARRPVPPETELVF